MESLDVIQFLDDKTILITGATGFLGKSMYIYIYIYTLIFVSMPPLLIYMHAYMYTDMISNREITKTNVMKVVKIVFNMQVLVLIVLADSKVYCLQCPYK
jgi:hypothetical protein